MYSSAISRVSSRGGFSRMFLSEPEARMLVSFFSLHGFTTMSSPRGVFGDDHAFVDRVAGGDEHDTALLEVIERIGNGWSTDEADHHPVWPSGNIAFDGPILEEVVVHDRFTLGRAHQPVAQADQSRAGIRNSIWA